MKIGNHQLKDTAVANYFSNNRNFSQGKNAELKRSNETRKNIGENTIRKSQLELKN